MEDINNSLPYILIGAYILGCLIFALIPMNTMVKSEGKFAGFLNRSKALYNSASIIVCAFFTIVIFAALLSGLDYKTNILMAVFAIAFLIGAIFLRLKTKYKDMAAFILSGSVLIGLANSVVIWIKHLSEKGGMQ